MSWSVNDLQTQIAVEVDQDDSPPTTGGTDWNIRINLLNRASKDWSESYDWEVLKKVHNGLISTSSANASYALPNDFKKLDSFPKIVTDGVNTYDLPVVDPSKNRRYTSSDKYINVLGNSVMYINAGTLASGASVQFAYYAHPASLSTTSQISECPDPTYLVQRSLYYLYKGREDGRFPEAKQEADRILARMIENENALGRAYVDRKIETHSDTYPSWRIGRD